MRPKRTRFAAFAAPAALLLVFVVSAGAITYGLGGFKRYRVDEAFDGPSAQRWVPVLGNWEVIEGEYAASGKANKHATAYYSAPGNTEFSDFTFEADLRQITGGKNNMMGVVFRLHDLKRFNGYGFYIAADGFYTFVKWVKDREVFIVFWKRTPPGVIRAGQAATNSIKVVAQGPKIELYVNGTLLNALHDTTFSSGKIAIDAFHRHRTYLTKFDNVRVQ